MNRIWTVLVMLLVLSMTPISANTECVEDLTGQTIRFYHFGDLSSIYAQLTLPVLNGFEDAIAYFNEQGGICGATIAMEYRDTGGSQAAAQAAWDEFSLREDAYIMFMYLTEDAELLREQAAQKEIPIVVSSGSLKALYGDAADSPGWVFSVTPMFMNQLGAFCDYISENWAQFGIEGDPVIGHVSFLGALGESSDSDEARAYCESKGVGYAGARYFFPGVPDISPMVQGVLDGGANIIYTTSVANGPAQVAATLAALGLRDEVLVAGPNIVLDTSVMQLGGEATNGIVGQLPYLWWDEVEHPGIQTVVNYWSQNRLPQAENAVEALETRNVAYLVAWAAVDAYRDIMISTINRVGFENLSGRTFYDSMTSGQTFSALDGVITLTYSETSREPHFTRIGAIQFVETDSGLLPRILPLTDFVEVPDLKPGGADVVN
ncbi:MAG: ABC transporter substrate-binding protein [Anaerolineae bacterium]|nr:ABC transporter substrate-binding protein [Anaerolineae bacterium]